MTDEDESGYLTHLPYQNISSDLGGQQIGSTALLHWIYWMILEWPSLLAAERFFTNKHRKSSSSLFFFNFLKKVERSEESTRAVDLPIERACR